MGKRTVKAFGLGAGWRAAGMAVTCLWPLVASAEPGACLLTCGAAQTCEVERPPHRTKSSLDRKNFTKHLQCSELTVTQGSVLMRYRHKGQWFVPPEAVTEKLAKMLAAYPPDACAIPSPACTQATLREKGASRAGHGIDSQVSAPAGIGDPCTKGLPCGAVLPPGDTWRFSLEGPALNGHWKVRVARGTPPSGVPSEFTVDVMAGVVSVAGTKLAPGLTYAYELLSQSGASQASGEFVLIGASRLALLKKLAVDRAVKMGLEEPAAWVDVLAANGMDWDVLQLIATR
jgi:hypothetical protein